MSNIRQLYSDNETRQRLFPRLGLAITESHFISSLNAHINYLNDLVEGTSPRELYNSWSMYSAFFPRLDIANNDNIFKILLKIRVDEMKNMIDSIVTEKIANEYIKILKNGCDEVYALYAIERLAREEMEAAEESSEDFKQKFLEPEINLEDITNEHYDAVLALDKKSNKRLRRGCDNSEEKLIQRMKVLPANFSKEVSVCDSEDDDRTLRLNKVSKAFLGLLKKTKKYQENNLAKRKISKLRLQRQDKHIVEHSQNYECVYDEYDKIYLDSKSSILDDMSSSSHYSCNSSIYE